MSRKVPFSPDGRRLATAGNAIYLWNRATGKSIRKLDLEQICASSVAFAPDGKTLATANWDRTIRLWDGATGKEIYRLEGHQGPVRSVAFSTDGQNLASASDDATLLVWNIRRFGAIRPSRQLTSQELGKLWAGLAGDAAQAHLSTDNYFSLPATSRTPDPSLR